MKKLSFLTVCLFTVFVSLAQSDSVSTPIQLKFKSFKASIRTMDKKMIIGRLDATNDSQLVLGKPFIDPHPVPVENINSFTLKRKNSIQKGALIGLGMGALIGTLIGLAGGNDPDVISTTYDPILGYTKSHGTTAVEKALKTGFGLGVAGAGMGAIIGALAKKKFIIRGKKETYRDLQGELMMKLVQK